MTAWIVGVGVGLVVAGFAADRLALWMESKRWIYWKRSERRGSASLGILETIYQPSMVYVFEEETRQLTEAEQDASGEDHPRPPEF